jgi:uncharacterized tellurite resistance protein B-like protein
MARDPILESLESLLRTTDPAAPPVPDDTQIRAAVAVLLVQVVRADAEVRHDEHRALTHVLQRVLGLSEAEADALVRHAEADVAQGVLFRDVVTVVARCGDDVKKKVVHAMWRVAFADAELQGHEEYLVRKVAEQIQLSTADLVETKVRAREEFLKEDL